MTVLVVLYPFNAAFLHFNKTTDTYRLQVVKHAVVWLSPNFSTMDSRKPASFQVLCFCCSGLLI